MCWDAKRQERKDARTATWSQTARETRESLLVGWHLTICRPTQTEGKRGPLLQGKESLREKVSKMDGVQEANDLEPETKFASGN